MEVKKMVTLKSSDGEEFEVEEVVAMESQTLRNMIEDECADSAIPLDNVTSKTLSKVIEYCRKHAESAGGEDLKAWDADFVKVDHGTLYNLIMAANFLDIKRLLDLICQRVADMIKGKSPDQIRKTFGIKNDFTPEEYDVILKENQWAFD